jgi:hypothetical protein
MISPGVWKKRRCRVSGVTVAYPPPRRVRLTFFAQDSGTHNLVYATG